MLRPEVGGFAAYVLFKNMKIKPIHQSLRISKLHVFERHLSGNLHIKIMFHFICVYNISHADGIHYSLIIFPSMEN